MSSAYGCNVTAGPPAKLPIFTETSYWFDNVASSSVKKVVSITIQQGEERIAIVSLAQKASSALSRLQWFP